MAYLIYKTKEQARHKKKKRKKERKKRKQLTQF